MSDVLQMVIQNYGGFTKKEMVKYLVALKAPVIIGHPSERYIKYLVSRNLDNYPVTIPYVENSHKSFGPFLGWVHGKTI